MTQSRPSDDTYTALLLIVRALDSRFPDGNSPFQRASRLAEECGELAQAVNHREHMGIKYEKHGESSDEQLVKEVQDVLRAALGIAVHYGVERQLESSVQDFLHEYRRQVYI